MSNFLLTKATGRNKLELHCIHIATFLNICIQQLYYIQPLKQHIMHLTVQVQTFHVDCRYDSGYRTPSRNEIRDEPLEEPPPDYSPPSPPPMPSEKKQSQKTRFSNDSTPQKVKSGNIIGKFEHKNKTFNQKKSIIKAL